MSTLEIVVELELAGMIVNIDAWYYISKISQI